MKHHLGKCKLLKPSSRTVLILDSLNETHDNHQAELLRTSERLIEQSNNLKGIGASRRNDSIASRLERGINISVEATGNTKDIMIMTFVHNQIERLEDQRFHERQKAKGTIVSLQ